MNIDIPTQAIEDFCRRWKVVELSLFGSVLRDDFRPDSDVDVLVVFAPDAAWRWRDRARMEEELEELFGRRVDLVEKDALENPFRRREILRTHRVVYAA